MPITQVSGWQDQDSNTGCHKRDGHQRDQPPCQLESPSEVNRWGGGTFRGRFCKFAAYWTYTFQSALTLCRSALCPKCSEADCDG